MNEEDPMHRRPIDPVIPSAQESALAETSRAALAAGQRFTTGDLPPNVARLLMDILEQTAAGNAVALVPVEAEVTTQQAADLLNVSRPFVVRLVENGTLPAHKVGKHRRLSLRDVLAYKAAYTANGEQALDEVIAFDQESGLF
jgi:excisionase family DNA binding protein